MTTTHIWLRRASGVRTTLEALTTGTLAPCAGTYLPLLDFSRLQGMYRDAILGLSPNAFLGSLPLQRHHHIRATAGIPAPVLPAPRFSQPPSEPTRIAACGFVPPRRHSEGYDLQSLTPDRSVPVSRP